MGNLTPAERLAALNALFDAGLTFADCVNAYATRQQSEATTAVIARARKQEVEGSLEFDDHVVVSGGTGGSYVMAWVWVDDVTSTDSPDQDVRDRAKFERILALTDPRNSTAAAQIAAAKAFYATKQEENQ